MIDVRIVDKLPVLNQELFPLLPIVPERTVFRAMSTAWGNTESEWAVGIVASICAKAKIWRPVYAFDFLEYLRNDFFSGLSRKEVIKCLFAFAEDGTIEIVQLGDKQYVIPTPLMAKVLFANLNALRFYKLY